MLSLIKFLLFGLAMGLSSLSVAGEKNDVEFSYFEEPGIQPSTVWSHVYSYVEFDTSSESFPAHFRIAARRFNWVWAINSEQGLGAPTIESISFRGSDCHAARTKIAHAPTTCGEGLATACYLLSFNIVDALAVECGPISQDGAASSGE